jgi:hypothetical protein
VTSTPTLFPDVIMPSQMTIDPERQRLTITSKGPVTINDALRIISEQEAAGAWHYSMLVDARRLDLVGFGEDSINVLADHKTAVGGGRLHGPVAAVADPETVPALTSLYTALCTRVTGLVMGIFQDFESAEEWLGKLPPDSPSSRQRLS